MPPRIRDLMGFPPDVAAALVATAVRLGRESPDYDPARPPLAVFDWDNTLVWNDIGDAAFDAVLSLGDLRLADDDLRLLLPEELSGRERRAPILTALREGRSGDPNGLAALRAEMHALYDALGKERGPAERYRWVATLFAGRTSLELESLAREVIREGLAEPLWTERVTTPDGRVTVGVAHGLRVFPGMIRLCHELARAGLDVRIVSASAEPLVRAFARQVGLDPACVTGARLAEDPAGGNLLPRIVEPFPYAEGKLETIDRSFGRRPVVAAGDSMGDLAMLEAASEVQLVLERPPLPSELGSIARARGFLLVPADDLLGVGE